MQDFVPGIARDTAPRKFYRVNMAFYNLRCNGVTLPSGRSSAKGRQKLLAWTRDRINLQTGGEIVLCLSVTLPVSEREA